MSNYITNLKSAVKKMNKDKRIAGNQLVFKEKEALLVTGTVLSIPIIGIILSVIITMR
ncbi:MAG: hypothetical protein AB2421_14280 [Thermotaleaceae bacterium]